MSGGPDGEPPRRLPVLVSKPVRFVSQDDGGLVPVAKSAQQASVRAGNITISGDRAAVDEFLVLLREGAS